MCVLYSLNSFLIRLLFSLFFHFNISTFFFLPSYRHIRIFFFTFTLSKVKKYTSTTTLMSTLNETFYGFVETTTDTLLIFEACRRGILPKINRRLQERERGAVRSGTVFVFDERESGRKEILTRDSGQKQGTS